MRHCASSSALAQGCNLNAQLLTTPSLTGSKACFPLVLVQLRLWRSSGWKTNLSNFCAKFPILHLELFNLLPPVKTVNSAIFCDIPSQRIITKSPQNILRTSHRSFVRQIVLPSTIAYKATSRPLHAYFLWFLKPTYSILNTLQSYTDSCLIISW